PLSAHVPWEHGRRFRALPCDAIYFPHFEDAPRHAGGPERFVTVHDCIPFLEDGPYKRAAILRSVRALMARRILRNAHVAAISRATRKDVVRLFEIERDEVVLLIPAPHPQFTGEAGDPAADDALGEIALPARYVLATGGGDPRKRNRALVRTWPRVLGSEGTMPEDAAGETAGAGMRGAGGEGTTGETTGETTREVTGETTREPGAPGGPLHLVIAGSPTRAEWETELRAEIEQSPARAFIHRLPQLPFAALPALYRRAQALAFLSTHEGFGLPPLEAMACGTPVLAAREPAVDEAVDDAVRRVESVEVGELSDAVREITCDAGLRADLRARGRERVARFSWDETARTLLTWIRSKTP
ncbi:MAG: glycosyltransferase family 4 protein, partial [Gemmatimonadetes bacterium]|nr:glycosyltransferase family 4 protein [Gemmatimonadota bacterium]